MSDQLKVAIVRSVYGAVVIAGSAFFATLATGTSLKIAGIAAGAAFFATLVTRGAIEGAIDTQAAKPVTPPA